MLLILCSGGFSSVQAQNELPKSPPAANEQRRTCFNCLSNLLVILLMYQTLHSGKINKNAFKALIVAEYIGVEINTTPNFEMGVTNKTPEFLRLNPLGKVYDLRNLLEELVSEQRCYAPGYPSLT
jgi:hypothetical protein